VAFIVSKKRLTVSKTVDDLGLYPESNWYHDPDLTAVSGVDSKYWKDDGAGNIVPMTQGEQDALDASTLTTAKANKKATLRLQVEEYFVTRYQPTDQSWFQMLYIEANQSGKTNRRTYLGTWFTWMEGCVSHVKDKLVAVGDATSVAAVDAVALNTTAMTAADPDITLGGALALTD